MFVKYVKFKMANKNGTKTIFWENRQMSLRIPWGAKNFAGIAPSRTISGDKCIFAFYTEIQDGRQKWQEKNFWEKHQMTLHILWG